MRNYDPTDDTDLPPRDGTLPPYTPPTTPTPVPQPKKKSKATLIFVVTVVVFVLLACLNH